MKKRQIKIYTLSHPITGEIRYIGKTHFSLNERLAKHMITFEKNHRSNWIKSIAKMGKKPVIELLEEVSKEEWVNAERLWIEQFKQWGFRLLNHSIGGKGGVISEQCRKAQKEYLKKPEFKLHLKRIQNISKERQSKIVFQYDKKGNFINKYPSASEAARQVNGRLSHITECCNGKPKRLTHKGFIWKYKVEDIV